MTRLGKACLALNRQALQNILRPYCRLEFSLGVLMIPATLWLHDDQTGTEACLNAS